MLGVEESCIEGFGVENLGKEVTWQKQVQMGG